MIDKVSGIHATSVSLNDRFTILAEVLPERPTPWQRPRTPARFYQRGNASNNQAFKNALARRYDRQAKIAAFRQRLGVPQPMYRRYNNGGMRRGGMRRSNSFGDLSQASFGNYSQASFGRRSYNSFGGLSRSASFDNLTHAGRGGWRRGFRRQGQNQWRFNQFRFRGNQQWQFRGQQRRGRGNMGGIQRNYQQRQQKPVPSKEQLDNQLDEYMSSSKHILDQQLDDYMRMADLAVAEAMN